MEMWKGSLKLVVIHQQVTKQENKRHVPWIHAKSHHQRGAIKKILVVTMKRLIKDSTMMLSHLVRGRVIKIIVANKSPMRSLMDRLYIMYFMIQVGPCT